MVTLESAMKAAAFLDAHAMSRTAAIIRDLASQVESLQADAERYRWFRQAGEKQNYISRLQEEKLDAAIDEARKQS